jgi:hypothetical protein
MSTWQEVNGDETYALDWELNEDSHVWEIGGFEGVGRSRCGINSAVILPYLNPSYGRLKR